MRLVTRVTNSGPTTGLLTTLLCYFREGVTIFVGAKH